MGTQEQIKEIERELTDKHIPSGWNIYEWAAENPDTTIANSLKRVEKVFDRTDAIYIGASGGKDSTLAQELASLELLRRRDRVERQIKRDGTPGIDILDAKWAHHLLPEGELKESFDIRYGTRARRILLTSMDAEWIYTATEEALLNFMAIHGPDGNDTVDMFWFCLQLGWQNGTSFSDARLNSWDPDKTEMWIRPMPIMADGTQVISNDTMNSVNLVPAGEISLAAYDYFKNQGSLVTIKGQEFISNFGYGSLENKHTGTLMGAPGLDEDFFQEFFSKWFANISAVLFGTNSIPELIKTTSEPDEKEVWELKAHEYQGFYATPVSLISLRASESFDRRTILLQGEYSTGQYSRSNGVNTCSVVFDYTTPDVWRLLSATDWGVSSIYNDMYESGIPVEKQRTGSLLNYAATRNIGDVKAIEPALYARITARFSNVEFFSQFSKSGYYKIQKPKDMAWDGRNHVKSGSSSDLWDLLDDDYKELLDDLNISYKFHNHVFTDMKLDMSNHELVEGMSDTAYYKSMERSGFKVIRPLLELTKMTGKSIEELTGGKFSNKMNLIHNSWRDYALFLLNTSNPQALENTREKVVTSITSWKYGTGSAPEPTLSALRVLSDIPHDLSMQLLDQNWESNSFVVKGRTNISGKYKLSLAQYPMESLEKMAADGLKYLLHNKEEDILRANKEFMDLSELWSQTDGMSLYALEAAKAFFAGVNWKDETLNLYKTDTILEAFSQKWYTAMEKAISIWFKEDIHSTSSWKRIAVAVLKGSGGVPDFGYIGFAPTYKERIARAEALQAFSSTKKEKDKAAQEFKKLESKISTE